MTTNVNATISPDAPTEAHSNLPTVAEKIAGLTEVELSEFLRNATPDDKFAALSVMHADAIATCNDLTKTWADWFRGCMVDLQSKLRYKRTVFGQAEHKFVPMFAPLDHIQARHVDTGLTCKFVAKDAMGSSPGTDIIRCDGEFVVGTASVSGEYLVMSDIETLARSVRALQTLELEYLRKPNTKPENREAKVSQAVVDWANEQTNVRGMSKALFINDGVTAAKDDDANALAVADAHFELRCLVLEVLAKHGANPRAAMVKPVKNQKGKGTMTYGDGPEAGEGDYPSITYRSLKADAAQQVADNPPKVLVTTEAFSALPTEIQKMLEEKAIVLHKRERGAKKKKEETATQKIKRTTTEAVTLQSLRMLQQARKQ